jgi:hypothetical protein
VAHLFVRRFKKDVRAQIRQDFPEREVYKLAADASPFKNRAVDCLAELRLTSDSAVRHDGAMLFRTTLEKALFSSPAACVQTIKERLRKQEGRDPTHPDLPALRELRDLVAAIGPAQFSKYRHLIEQLRSGPHWAGCGPNP